MATSVEKPLLAPPIAATQSSVIEEKDRKIDFLLSNARKLMENNETTLATNIYIHVLKLDPKIPEALRGLGMCLEKRNEFKKSEICYLRWARLTQSPESFTRLGGIYLKVGDENKAIACLEKALKQKGIKEESQFEILNHLGNSYLKNGLFNQAEECYQKALDLKPQSDRVMVNLGTLYFQKGKHQEALERYQKALIFNPRNSKALCGLGIIAQEQKLWLDAIKMYTKALEAEWDNLVAINGLIRCGQQVANFETIEKFLVQYLFHHPSNVAIIYCLAGNYFHQKKWNQCLEEIYKIELLDPYHEAASELKEMVKKAKELPKERASHE